MTVETIPNAARVSEVQYTPGFSAVCAVAHDPFHGVLHITVRPTENILEFISFEVWLKEVLKQGEVTIEDVARLVFDKLKEVLPDATEIEVEVHAKSETHAPVIAAIK